MDVNVNQPGFTAPNQAESAAYYAVWDVLTGAQKQTHAITADTIDDAKRTWWRSSASK